jgi:hypothetical protein
MVAAGWARLGSARTADQRSPQLDRIEPAAAKLQEGSSGELELRWLMSRGSEFVGKGGDGCRAGNRLNPTRNADAYSTSTQPLQKIIFFKFKLRKITIIVSQLHLVFPGSRKCVDV